MPFRTRSRLEVSASRTSSGKACMRSSCFARRSRTAANAALSYARPSFRAETALATSMRRRRSALRPSGDKSPMATIGYERTTSLPSVEGKSMAPRSSRACGYTSFKSRTRSSALTCPHLVKMRIVCGSAAAPKESLKSWYDALFSRPHLPHGSASNSPSTPRSLKLATGSISESNFWAVAMLASTKPAVSNTLTSVPAKSNDSNSVLCVTGFIPAPTRKRFLSTTVLHVSLLPTPAAPKVTKDNSAWALSLVFAPRCPLADAGLGPDNCWCFGNANFTASAEAAALPNASWVGQGAITTDSDFHEASTNDGKMLNFTCPQVARANETASSALRWLCLCT
mmetsp:Transcript_114490/g.287689  ORF Transcript_114490/g.287689 Transcript_114490/m.287689 type:complete len:340 (-) Transcript_114490:61-1080(-)